VLYFIFNRITNLTLLCICTKQFHTNINSWTHGCQMAYFQTKSPRYLIWVNFGWSRNGSYWYMAIWPLLLPFGIFCGHLVYFIVIWYICSKCSRFGMLYREKFGNPGWPIIETLKLKHYNQVFLVFHSSFCFCRHRHSEGGPPPT
jgi:hypothetical protein